MCRRMKVNIAQMRKIRIKSQRYIYIYISCKYIKRAKREKLVLKSSDHFFSAVVSNSNVLIREILNSALLPLISPLFDQRCENSEALNRLLDEWKSINQML